jgi:iron complex outermembrane receptor protein
MQPRRSYLKSILAATVFLAGTHLRAQTSAQAGASSSSTEATLTEVVVTAQKRSESIQKVPIAVTAFTGAQLQERAIVDIASLSSVVPNLNFGTYIGQALINIRGVGLSNGVGASAVGAVALNLDGVYVQRSWVALNEFFDLDRVEVLRGPQGTLYGRNATAGAVNVISHAPTADFESYIQVGGGNYGLFESEGVVSGPLLCNELLGRIAFQEVERDGYGKNLVTGTGIDDDHHQALRAELESRPNESLDFLITLNGFEGHSSSGGYHSSGLSGAELANGTPLIPSGTLAGGYFAGNYFDIAGTSPSHPARFADVALDTKYLVNPDLTIRLLSAYVYAAQGDQGDCDGSSADLCFVYNTDHSNQFSEELNVSWQIERNNLIGVLYWLRENLGGLQNAPFDLATVLNSFNPNPNLPFAPLGLKEGYIAGGRAATETEAVYLQDTFAVTDQLKLTAGARDTAEKQTAFNEFAFDLSHPFVPTEQIPYPGTALATATGATTWHALTPHYGVDFQLTPDVLLYTTYSKGFKSGTYNFGQVPLNEVAPERLTDVEAGVKATFFDQRLRSNLNYFHYNYTDLQVNVVVADSTVLANAASARMYGLEEELTAKPWDPLTIDLAAGWLHARFLNYISADPARPGGDGTTTQSGVPAFNLAGYTPAQSPKYNATLAADYAIPIPFGELSIRPEVTWTSLTYLTQYDRQLTGLYQPAYFLTNLSINFLSSDKRWQASLWGKNLTDRLIWNDGEVGSALVNGAILGYVDAPRTVGIRVRHNF